jgi:hypothetical protein
MWTFLAMDIALRLNTFHRTDTGVQDLSSTGR